MGFIAGAIAGAAFGLLRTAVEDLLQDDAPDQAKIDAVKEAQQKRMEELLAEGMPRPKAFDQAKAETREAMKEAMAVTDNVTMGDYIGNMTTDALMGGGLGWASGTARGASALNKAKSFLGRGVKPGDASPIPGVKTDIRGMGASSDIRGMGQSSLNSQMAPGRMPIIGKPATPSLNAPGPTGMGVADDILPGAKSELMSGIPGARSSLRAVPVGPATGGAHPMEGASSKLGKLVQADVWPEEAVAAARLGMRNPKTIDTTAELVSPGLGMADDALLNPMIDDIINAAMGQAPKRIGFRLNGRVPMPVIDPKQGAMGRMSFLDR